MYLRLFNRFSPPPCRETALPRRKIFFTFLIFARAVFFLKGKENFFCFGFRAQGAGRRGFASARGQKVEGAGGRKLFARPLLEFCGCYC